MQKVIGIVVLLVVALGAYSYYKSEYRVKNTENGTYTCVGCMNHDDAERLHKQEAAEANDGQTDRKPITIRPEEAQSRTNGETASLDSSAEKSSRTSPANLAVDLPAQAAPQQTAGQPYLSGNLQPISTNLPSGDTQSANAPNGVRFSGSGGYQWYRQGNLTWRINTTTGSSCIIYATMNEWRKEVVLSHGCGRDV